MRINKYVALATGLSRRAADQAIQEGRVTINEQLAHLGDSVSASDKVTLDSLPITPAVKTLTIMLNKPAGYVVSRDGQGSQTIYDLLPKEFHSLKPVGRLDKDSSGLLLLTNDGDLANQLTHPSYAKTKVYEVEIDKPLEPLHQQMISDHGIQLEDGLSKLSLHKLDNAGLDWQITMSEGRNRQIRRTFSVLGYEVAQLDRQKFGKYSLQGLQQGQYKAIIDNNE
jgi:23S rRNA pseudouridine2605 synthase